MPDQTVQRVLIYRYSLRDIYCLPYFFLTDSGVSWPYEVSAADSKLDDRSNWSFCRYVRLSEMVGIFTFFLNQGTSYSECSRQYAYKCSLQIYIIKIKIHSSCEIEDFVETHLFKLCVILRSRALRVVCPH